MTLSLEQSNRLIAAVAEFDQLMTEANQDGAEAILDELYLLVTKLLERFPDLDKDEDEDGNDE